MGSTRRWTDDQLVDLVFVLRVRYGACTLGLLTDETGYSKTRVAQLVTALLKEGRLTQTAVDGSLRTADEIIVSRSRRKRTVEPVG